MTTDRCPACSAAVTPGAPWCTLCYAVLRQPEPVAVAAPAAPAIAEYGASSVDIARLPEAPLPPDPILDAPVVKAAPVAGVKPNGWPCLGCGALNAMSDDICSQCHRPFLASEELPSLAVPGVGDLRHMDRAQKIVVMIVGALLATGLLVALAFIAGSVL